MPAVVPFQSVFLGHTSVDVSAQVSLPAVVSNLLLLVDYVSTGATTPTPWPWDVWSRFDDDERHMRALLSPLLIHGLILQEHWLALPADHPAHHDWNALRATITEMSDDGIRALLAAGWVSGAQYYLHEMPRTDDLDRFLPENADELTDKSLHEDPDLLDCLHEFSFASWGMPEAERPAAIAFAQNPARVRAGILLLLDALWRHGAEDAWEDGASRLHPWTAQANARIAGQTWADASAAVRDLSGRTPPDAMQPMIAGASRIVMLPCLELGTTQRVAVQGETAFVMFEPAVGAVSEPAMAHDPMKLADAVALLRAVTDPAAFSLLQSLGTDDERYALEIAEESGIHQSTVSRHLSGLERLGAVSVRREGNAKFYSLRRDRIAQATAVMQSALEG